MMFQCKGFNPEKDGIGIAVLKADEVIGVWRFRKLGRDVLNLVAVSTDMQESKVFMELNGVSIADKMFAVILEFCRYNKCNGILYFEASKGFKKMIKRFEENGLISEPEQELGGTVHKITA